MPKVREVFLVAPLAQTLLKDQAGRKGDETEPDEVAIQCIELIHKLNTHWRAGRQIFRGEEPLDLPPPFHLGIKPIHKLVLWVEHPHQVSLNQFCRDNRIDKQSAIAWAIECMQIIDNSLMTHDLYAHKPGLWEPFTVGWIHKETAS